MPADIFPFEDFINSGRGLMARPILPNNQIATSANIAIITYTVIKIGSTDPPVTGTLNVADVMYATPQPWHKDKTGATFIWEADGSLWGTPGSYRIIVTFVTTPALGSKPFIRVWQADVTDPAA